MSIRKIKRRTMAAIGSADVVRLTLNADLLHAMRVHFGNDMRRMKHAIKLTLKSYVKETP